MLVFVLAGAISLGLLLLTRPRRATKMAPPESPAEEAAERAVSAEELAAATGENEGALYIAMKDPYGPRIVVFDVSAGAGFYGPGGPYNLFAGRHATHGLAKSSTDPANVEGDLSSLSAAERDTHMQWFAKYAAKYPKVGWLAESGDDTESSATIATTTTTDDAATESKKDA